MRAAVCHQAASDLRLAQATFNLGWMYHRGLGVRRDYHLAKRHYDLAAESAPEALWPTRLSLALLYAEWGAELALGREAAGGLASAADAGASTDGRDARPHIANKSVTG